MEKVICVVVVISLLCTSCATIKYAAPPDIGNSSFNAKPGDNITLYFKNGDRKVVIFEIIKNKTVYYIGGKADFKEIERVRIKRISWQKTTLTVAGGFVANVAVLWFAITNVMGDSAALTLITNM